MDITGTVIGYDPGGNNNHGFTRLVIENGLIKEGATQSLNNVGEVIKIAQEESSLIAVGVDTLTCWSTGESGWRPADLWLRKKYREIQNSVIPPNGLYGSMVLSGMALLVTLRKRQHDLFITETHPKVLFWFLKKERYDYKNKKYLMDETLIKQVGFRISPANEHEWDSVISAFAALQSIKGIWRNDLHKIPMTGRERLINPCGTTHFFWPE